MPPRFSHGFQSGLPIILKKKNYKSNTIGIEFQKMLIKIDQIQCIMKPF